MSGDPTEAYEISFNSFLLQNTTSEVDVPTQESIYWLVFNYHQRFSVIISHTNHINISLSLSVSAHQCLNIEHCSFERSSAANGLGSTAEAVLPLAALSSETKMSVQFLRLISRSNRQKYPPQLPPCCFLLISSTVFYPAGKNRPKSCRCHSR